MAVKKGGLGKGLDSLIPSGAPKNKKNITEEKKQPVKVVEKVVEKIVEKPVEMKMKITEVEPNREQPRKNFDEDALLELAESIKQFGVLQPLLVQKKDDYYEIIAGERRWRAAKLAGLKEVPVIIKDFSDQEVVEIALIENIQREDLNAIEEAVAYKRLMEEFHLKQDEIAERVSKSRTAVTNAMRLLKLDERVQNMLIQDMISPGHARTLLGIEDKDQQYNLAMRIFDEKLSVRDTEKIVKDLQKPKKEEKKKEADPQMEVIYQQLDPGFVGSFYQYSNQSETLKNNPDTVVAYTPTCNDLTYTNTDGQQVSGYVVSDVTKYSEANKYLCFICGDQPYERIDNPNITDGSSCVVIKESYGNAFVPFLVNSYQTVHVVDYRYFSGNLVDLVKDNNIQDVIYVNNANALIESAVKNMSRIIS